MDSQDQVYLGVWTNFARGGSSVMGATLTTTRRNGDLLIAFTALFIPYVMSRLWRIFCLIAHYYHSTPHLKDPIHHQRQIIFRNSTTADSGLFSFVLILLAWRHSPWKRLARIIPSALLAIAFIIIATVAGGYSSQISTVVGNEVLLKGDRCSILDYGAPGSQNFTTATRVLTRESERIMDAANYAQQCYSGLGSGLLGCNRFIVQDIPTVVKDYKAACPFSTKICKDNHTNVQLDTGYVDSTLHFGLNAPDHQRFAWRHVLTCAPLRTDGYTRTMNARNKTFITYHYGNSAKGSTDNRSTLNYTYMVSDLESQYSQSTKTPAGLNYRLYAILAVAEDGEFHFGRSGFLPVPEIARTDGNVIIAFLSGNGIIFRSPLDDGWYRATGKGPNMTTTVSTGKAQGYMFDEAASPLGCVQQWQWCNLAYPGISGCGPLASSLDAIKGALPKFNLTINQTATGNKERAEMHTTTGAHFLWSVMMQNSRLDGIYNTIASLGTRSLASQSSLFSGVQLAVNENQWQLDVTNWWNIILATYQSGFVETAIGESDPDLQPTLVAPSNEYERQACKSQKVRSTAYASFSLLGLLFTYITGVLFVGCSFILDPILRCLHRRKTYKQYEYLEWCTNDTMQLHRLAHSSEATTEQWMKCTDSVPVTDSNVLLAELDISNLKVPKIRCITDHRQHSLKVEEDDQESLPKPVNVNTVSSEDTLHSPDTNAEENNPGPRNGPHSRRESTEQHTYDLSDGRLADDTETHQDMTTADEGVSPHAARLSFTGESGGDASTEITGGHTS